MTYTSRTDAPKAGAQVRDTSLGDSDNADGDGPCCYTGRGAPEPRATYAVAVAPACAWGWLNVAVAYMFAALVIIKR